MVNDPIISVNKLGEYIVSKGARQRTLLSQRKYPDQDFNAGMFHREATEAIQKYIADGAFDQAPIDRTLQVLNQMAPEKIGTIRRIGSNISRLEQFQEMLDDIDLKGGSPDLGETSPQRLVIRNVQISVRPEIILRGKGLKNKKLIGGLKLHMAGTTKFNEEAAGYVSAVLQEFCKQFLAADDEVVYAPYCQVIDVGNGMIYSGVKATAQRMKDIEAECQNIFGLWPSI